MGDWLPLALEHKFKNYLQYSGLFTLSFPSSCQTSTSSTPCIYSLTLLCFFSIKNLKKKIPIEQEGRKLAPLD